MSTEHPTQQTRQGSRDQEAPVQILEESDDYSYKERYKIRRARLRYRKSDGEMGQPVTRLNFERGDSAGVLLYDPSRDTVLLVKQFRYPVYAASPTNSATGAEHGWLIEIIAGEQDDDQSLEEVARREAEEEVGLRIEGDLERVGQVFLSPGGSSEQVAIYFATVDSGQHGGQGGGLGKEGEDTELVELPYERAMEMLARGEIRDAKTMIALQYLALNKARQAHGVE